MIGQKFLTKNFVKLLTLKATKIQKVTKVMLAFYVYLFLVFSCFFTAVH